MLLRRRNVSVARAHTRLPYTLAAQFPRGSKTLDPSKLLNGYNSCCLRTHTPLPMHHINSLEIFNLDRHWALWLLTHMCLCMCSCMCVCYASTHQTRFQHSFPFESNWLLIYRTITALHNPHEHRQPARHKVHLNYSPSYTTPFNILLKQFHSHFRFLPDVDSAVQTHSFGSKLMETRFWRHFLLATSRYALQQYPLNSCNFFFPVVEQVKFHPILVAILGFKWTFKCSCLGGLP